MFRIAIKMLFGDFAKYIALVLGVAFSTLLINQQLGIFIGLLARAGAIIADAPEASLWVMDPGVRNFDTLYPLPDTELQRVRGVPGVAWAVPLFKSGASVRTRNGILEGCTLLGVDNVSLIGVPQRPVLGRIEDLKLPDAVAISADGYKRLFPGEPLELNKSFEMNDNRARIVAIIDSKPDFTSAILIYTRYRQALLYSNNGRNTMSVVVAHEAEGESAEVVANRIEKQLGLKCLTGAQYKQAAVDFIIANTGIPVSFGTVVALGVIIGVAVVALLFNLFVVENLRYFAALKALGLRNRRVIQIVAIQVALIGVVGYGVGLGAAATFFDVLPRKVPTFKGFYLPWQVAVGTAVVDIAIVSISALVALRKALVLDPAIVFRG